MMKKEFINYAHRGASEYYPENTLVSFYAGWLMGANGIETDVQMTKDGVLIISHDSNLMRVAGREDKITDLTYAQLMKVDVGAFKGEKFVGERVPKLEEFMNHFSGKGLELAIEIKQAGIEEELLKLLGKYDYFDHIVITSFILDSVIKVRELNPDVKTGYLSGAESDELLEFLKEKGVYQYCPRASVFTEEWNGKIREMGFSIRAWGVSNQELMKKMLDFRVDGMTVNFPDKLIEELNRRGEV